MTSSDTDAIRSHIHEHRQEWLDELLEFLRIPSVSTDTRRHRDVRAAAEWLRARLDEAGCEETALWETPGHPVVYGAWRGAGDEAPTILVYGHYDVQPEDPVEEWSSPPFDPEIRDGRIWARGAGDDKGQLYIHTKALQTWLAVEGRCPVNVLFAIEGEEEVGSPNIEDVVRDHLDELACDAVVISDSTMFAEGVPALCYGLRGLSYFEVRVKGPLRDLHSGSFGGAVANPAEALARMLAACRDPETDRVTIPGFYDDVVPLTDEERADWESLPFDREAYRRDLGVPAVRTEQGYTVLEAVWGRPTFEVNGLLSGFTGSGSKTVLPSKAMAKVSMRLVPDQDPDAVAEAFEAHLQEIYPPGVRIEVDRMQGARAWLAPRDHPALQAAGEALRRGFRAEPVFVREGGTIPLVPLLDDLLGVPTVMMGIALPDMNAHGPDENLPVDNFYAGIAAAAYFHEELARQA